MINLQNIVKNIQKSKNFNGELRFSESMKEHTTFKVGGNAKAFIVPENEESLLVLLQELIQNNIDYFILGGGSNIVVSDAGLDVLVISTQKLNHIELITASDNSLSIKCSSGCTIEALTQFCINNELSGLENFAGLPGSVGGALYMNARCYEVSISDVLIQAQFADSDNYSIIKTYIKNNKDWDYKLSPFQKKNPLSIVLSADFTVTKSTKIEVANKSSSYIQDRESKGHFSHPSAGSVFKNNRNFGKSSGQIIDSAGLKGFRKGNAQIAPWHGNFIINLGGASADDIKEVVDYAKATVLQRTGKMLECEILFVGKFD